MKRNTSWPLFFAATAAAFLVSACSKNESTSANPTATPIPTATVLPASSPTIAPVYTPAATETIAPEPQASSSPLADLDQRLRNLESHMDSIFTNAFRDFGSWSNQSTLASSFNLSEEKDKYVVRVYLPHGDSAKVNANVVGDTLHITTQNDQAANGTTESEHSEQIIGLSKPIQADKLHIDRKPNLVVISIPKAATSAPAVAANPSPAASAAPALTANDWESKMQAQIRDMERRMNGAFRDLMPNDLSFGSADQLGSAVNVDDQKDKYVVHFSLPDRNVADVNVKFENGQLDLTATAQNKSSNKSPDGTVESSSSGRYEQMIQLPGPVNDAAMKVERKDGAVVITLPKAGTAG